MSESSLENPEVMMVIYLVFAAGGLAALSGAAVGILLDQIWP